MKILYYPDRAESKNSRMFIFYVLLFTLAGPAFSQQNISQSPNSLDFFPKTSGQLTVWESSTAFNTYSGSPEYALKAYDGNRRFTLLTGSTNVNQVSGNAALVSGKKRYYNGTALVDMPEGSTDAIISGYHVFWTDSGVTGLNYFYKDPATSQPIYSADPGPKNLLSATGTTLVYAQDNHTFLAKVNGGVTQLTTDPYPTYFVSDSMNLVWIQSDGHDGEVFYYDGALIHQITSNEEEEIAPVVSGNKIVWQVAGSGVKDLFFFDGLTAQKITNGSFSSFSNVAIVNGKPVFESGGAVYYFNGAYVEKLAQDLKYNTFVSSKIFAAWVKDNGDNTQSVYSFNGSVVKKELTVPSIYYMDGNSVDLGGSLYVYDSYYDPSEIFEFDFIKGAYSNYKIGDVSTSSCLNQSIFNVPLLSKDSLKPGLVGLDFILHYDTNLFIPTGVATLTDFDPAYGAFGLNKNVPGKIFVNIYLNGAPEGHYLHAIGKLIDIQFSVKSGAPSTITSSIASEMVRENFPIESWDVYPADSGLVSTGNGTAAQLIYREFSDRPITYNMENPEEFLPTDIYSAHSGLSCVSDTSVRTRPDENGYFFLPITNNNFQLSMQRDIPGDYFKSPLECSDVMGIINAADRNKALEIANFTITNPSAYDLVAADVNLDGKVTSADVALISSRTVNANYCEFPQKNNYSWDGAQYVPIPTYRKSLDWLFIIQNQTYLNNYVSSFDRNNVPVIGSGCLPNGTGTCGIKYIGILLGDVAPSWTTADGGQLRTAASENKIILDFSALIQDAGNNYLVPVKISGSNNVKALDFSFELGAGIAVKGLRKDAAYNQIGTVWNNIASKKAMFTAFDEKGFVPEGSILYVALQTEYPADLSAGISHMKAFINGEPAAVETSTITGATTASGSSGKLQLVPNPSSGRVSLQSGFLEGNVKIELLNSLGQVLEIFTENISGNYMNKTLDVSHLSSGTYMVKVTSGSEMMIERLVIR